MQITDKATKTVRESNKAKAALCSAFDRHMKTIELWLDEKNIILTTPTAVAAISDATGLAHDEILEPVA
jgi:hypothetical protein